jgi:hypothetical protein
MSEPNYIGPDPVLWVERLREVNLTSQFPYAAKQAIEASLVHLLSTLSKVMVTR